MIHALTLNWNGVSKLQKLACSLNRAASVVEPITWHIRDNGSTDGSIEWLQSKSVEGPRPEDFEHLEFETLLVDHNRDNFAQGVNSLVETLNLSSNDVLMLLNNDVEFADEYSLSKMMTLLQRPEIGVVGARLLYNNSNKLQHAGVIFGERYGKMPYHFRHQEESDQDAKKNRYFQAVTAACCLIKPDAVQKLDTTFRWSFEDIDLMLRIGQSGWKIAYCGETEIYHEESASLKKNPVNKMFMRHNVQHFKNKWFGKYELDHQKYLSDKSYGLID